MRLGIFGGSFDPVHHGHLLLAECCREEARLDRVLFLPAAVSPLKLDRTISSPKQRIEMLQLAIGGHEAFELSTLELDRGGVSYTVETLRQLTADRPADELFLMLGADSLRDLPKWREPAAICQLASLLVVRRGGLPPLDYEVLRDFVEPTRREYFRSLEVTMPLMELSSTELRQRVATGRSLRYRVPRAVEEYIRQQGLYSKGE
jgi:nicotinate-nucleotide adenylyltransferase